MQKEIRRSLDVLRRTLVTIALPTGLRIYERIRELHAKKLDLTYLAHLIRLAPAPTVHASEASTSNPALCATGWASLRGKSHLPDFMQSADCGRLFLHASASVARDGASLSADVLMHTPACEAILPELRDKICDFRGYTLLFAIHGNHMITFLKKNNPLAL